MQSYVANAIGPLPDPFKVTVSEKAKRLPVASTSDCREHLWPQSMPGLRMVLDRNVMELTPQKQPLANDKKARIEKYPSFFSFRETTQRYALCHLPETPKWGRVPAAYCCDVFINVSSNGFPFLPCFPSPFPYRCSWDSLQNKLLAFKSLPQSLSRITS